MINYFKIISIGLVWFFAEIFCTLSANGGEPEILQPTKRFVLSFRVPSYEVPVWTGVAVDAELRAYVGGDDHMIRVWNPKTDQLEKKLARNVDWVKAVRLRPDGLLVLTADMRETGIFWQTTPKKSYFQLKGLTASVNCAEFSADGTKVALGLFNGSVVIYDAVSGAMVSALGMADSDVNAVAFSPDGSQLAAAGRSGVIRLWNLSQTRNPVDLKGHTRRVAALAFRSDGKLVSGAEDKTVILWDTGAQANGTPTILSKIENLPGKVRSLTPCQNETIAVSTTANTLSIWDLASKTELKRLTSHTGTVHDMQFVPSVQWLYTVGFDCALCVWDLSSQEQPK